MVFNVLFQNAVTQDTLSKGGCQVGLPQARSGSLDVCDGVGRHREAVPFHVFEVNNKLRCSEENVDSRLMNGGGIDVILGSGGKCDQSSRPHVANLQL